MLRKYMSTDFLRYIGELDHSVFKGLGVTLTHLLAQLYSFALGAMIGFIILHFTLVSLPLWFITFPVWGVISLDIITLLIVLTIYKLKK